MHHCFACKFYSNILNTCFVSLFFTQITDGNVHTVTLPRWINSSFWLNNYYNNFKNTLEVKIEYKEKWKTFAYLLLWSKYSTFGNNEDLSVKFVQKIVKTLPIPAKFIPTKVKNKRIYKRTIQKPHHHLFQFNQKFKLLEYKIMFNILKWPSHWLLQWNGKLTFSNARPHHHLN